MDCFIGNARRGHAPPTRSHNARCQGLCRAAVYGHGSIMDDEQCSAEFTTWFSAVNPYFQYDWTAIYHFTRDVPSVHSYPPYGILTIDLVV
ncbi:hypothetical protein Hypma_008380 [Hypsizygus marmoreus]|uniref:Uncharacterized protein n=1 Tax=Hypsizygus marmoreus TaxID=39966 RepID=A0A369JTA1_HYPMA|nr:hypothetical protein Hypma_008380 [Hypsizygus marmoreus]